MKSVISILLSFLLFFSNQVLASHYTFKKKFSHSPNILHHKLKVVTEKSKKITAAVLAFPLPFGFFGAHRIYLGSKPAIPITYIATIGGCVGILPLIDFFVILSTKDLKKFENNQKIFMWNNSKKSESRE